MVRRWWRFVVDNSKLVLLGLEIFITVGADFAIRAGFMCSTMSGEWVNYPSYLITSGVCTMHKLTERGYQTAKRPSGNAGKRMVVPECGFSHV